jgi:DNA-binding transcriptional LysR family regulator
MRFTLRQIEYFLAAAETGSITRAAEAVHISQPAISAAIAGLEAQFGVQLFIRHHAQGLSLTAEGRRLGQEARALHAQALRLEAAGVALSAEIAGEIEIGCMVTLYSLVVPELMAAFRSENPSATLHAVPGNPAELLELLRQGKLAMVITYDIDLPGDVDFLALAPLPPFAFVAADHALAGRTAVRLQELADEPFVLLDLPLSRDYFLFLFHQAGLTPRIGEGFGIANAQPRNRASLDGLPLAYLELESDLRPLTYGLALLKGGRRSLATQALLDLCGRILRGRALPGTVQAVD